MGTPTPFVPHRCLVLALPYPTSKRSRKNHPPTYRPADHQLATTPSKTPEPYTEFDDTRDESTNSLTEAALSKLLGVSTNSSRRSMDRGATQYSQSESADHASAAHYTPEVRSNNYSTSATPTSEYGIYPTSARSGSFPEHIQRQYHPSSNHSGSNGGGMAQPTNPSIAASSPTYPQHNGQYSPYPQQGDMSHGYPQHPAGGAMYTQPRPDWAGYAGGQHPMHGGYPVSGAQTPTSAAPAGARPGQVYSFVPIPGAQQHKRPRRRYEEIERMYKCGWNGCEKAYGTLNHLNAHVTMQSHGQKRTPEEFKEIRKEWKARKKEEENQRKADEERQRQADPRGGEQHDQQPYGQMRTPLGPQPSPGMDSMGHYPQSPYAPSGQVYQQQEDTKY